MARDLNVLVTSGRVSPAVPLVRALHDAGARVDVADSYRLAPASRCEKMRLDTVDTVECCCFFSVATPTFPGLKRARFRASGFRGCVVGRRTSKRDATSKMRPPLRASPKLDNVGKPLPENCPFRPGGSVFIAILRVVLVVGSETMTEGVMRPTVNDDLADERPVFIVPFRTKILESLAANVFVPTRCGARDFDASASHSAKVSEMVTMRC